MAGEKRQCPRDRKKARALCRGQAASVGIQEPRKDAALHRLRVHPQWLPWTCVGPAGGGGPVLAPSSTHSRPRSRFTSSFNTLFSSFSPFISLAAKGSNYGSNQGGEGLGWAEGLLQHQGSPLLLSSQGLAHTMSLSMLAVCVAGGVLLQK